MFIPPDKTWLVIEKRQTGVGKKRFISVSRSALLKQTKIASPVLIHACPLAASTLNFDRRVGSSAVFAGPNSTSIAAGLSSLRSGGGSGGGLVGGVALSPTLNDLASAVNKAAIEATRSPTGLTLFQQMTREVCAVLGEENAEEVAGGGGGCGGGSGLPGISMLPLSEDHLLSVLRVVRLIGRF